MTATLTTDDPENDKCPVCGNVLNASGKITQKLRERIAGLENEVAEWKQAAEVEAGLRREFQDKAEKLQERLDDNASQFEDRKFY